MKRRPARCRECKVVIKRGKCDCRQRVKAYLPSQAEIAAGCRAIQATWDEDEEYNRRARKEPRGWCPPVACRREIEESIE